MVSEVLGYGHPGVIQLPHWQDVGVKWSGLESADVTTHAVYDYADLTEIGVEEFSRRTLKVLAELSEDSSG